MNNKEKDKSACISLQSLVMHRILEEGTVVQHHTGHLAIKNSSCAEDEHNHLAFQTVV